MRWAWPLLGLCACVSPPDPFALAERALLAQDLPGALVAFDAIPVSHARYPEARATALTVERRLRRSHELVLEALMLRAEWQDDEALAPLSRARTIWPRMPGIDCLIRATRQRAALLGTDATEDDPGARVVMVEVPQRVGGESQSVAPAPDAGLVAEPPREWAPTNRDPMPAQIVRKVPLHEDPVALGLVSVEISLGRGELEAAVVNLIELSERFPADRRIESRLARVLHQRALMRYGHGQLVAAIEDWERVVSLDCENAVAASLLESARAEAKLAEPVKAESGATKPAAPSR